MELEINNIKTWENFKFKIEQSYLKHVLICGISGIGKTTILECIFFALTGGYLTNKWGLRHKKKQGYVKLNIKNLQICRTLNPKSLEVIVVDSGTCSGDEAQEMIYKFFDHGLFKHIGYLRQKSTYSYFISLPPRDKMMFIENVVFNEIDIDTSRTLIKDEIDKAKANCTHYDVLLSKLNQKNVEPIVKQSDIDDLEKHINWLQTQQAELSYAVNSVNLLESKLQEYQIIQYELSKDESELELQRNKMDLFLNTMTNKLNLYKKLVKEYEDTDVFYKKYADMFKNQIVHKKELEKKLVNLEELEEQIVTQERMMELYENYINVEKRINDLKYDEELHLNLLETYNNSYLVYGTCPNCDTLLGGNLNGLQIIKGGEKNLNNDELVEIKNTIADMNNKQLKYKILRDILNELETKLRFPIWTRTEMENKLLVRKQQTEFRKEYDKLLTGSATTTTTPTPIPRVCENEYNHMKSEIDTHHNYTTRKQFIDEQIDKIKLKTTSINEKIHQVISELEESTFKLEKLNTINDDLEKHQSDLENLKETFEYQTVYYAYMQNKQVWDDYLQFQKIFNKTRSDVIMYILETINTLIKKYVDGFFENYNFQFSFYVNEKDSIDVHIEYDNANPSDLSILSGGEYDRIVLAVALAFGEFYKLPLLLFDEITSSFDLHTLQLVMNHIHKCYPDDQSVIYVGHQMISGNFDYILDLDLI